MKFNEYTESMNPVYADTSMEEVIKTQGGTSIAEVKEDGYRCQIHANGKDVKMFTRQSNEYAYECYPEIIKAVQDLNLTNTVLDAEIKGQDIGYQGFLQIRKRFRRVVPKKKKYDDYQELIKEFPLQLVVFDTLMFEGQPLLNTEMQNRRTYTEKIFGNRVSPSELFKISSEAEFDKLFLEQVKKVRHEGLVIKCPTSQYIGKKKELYQKDEKYNWVKVKNFETLDLAVIAFQKGKGEYNKGMNFASAVCAMKNQETGLYDVMGSVSLARKNPITDNSYGIDLEEMITQTSGTQPNNVRIPEKLAKKYENLIYVHPQNSQVIEIRAMNIDKDKEGEYTMRIAHINDIREDKNIGQTTTLKEVEELHEIQKGAKK